VKKLILSIIAAVLLTLSMTACFESDADVASENLSKAADQFEVLRRVVFYNGINGEYMLVIEGFCSLGNFDSAGELTVTCKVGEGQYKKHFLGLSDNVSYFVEQGEPVKASANHYRVTFKPQSILPDVDFRGSSEDLPTSQP